MTSTIEEEYVESLSSMGKKLSVKKFIWCEEEWPKIKHNEFSNEEDIPIISLHGVFENKIFDSKNYETICKSMVNASEIWGFFKLIDHGIDFEIIEKTKMYLNNFFDLSMEEKMKGCRSRTMPLGYCATNIEYEKNLPWAEILQLLQSPQQVNEFGIKIFGEKQHRPFSDAIIEYMNKMDKLGIKIFEMLAIGLDIPKDFFAKNFEDKESTMLRVNRYPRCPLPEKCLGLGSHSDPHTLTILLQDEVGGLQVLKNDSQWIGIQPIPNSFIVNIGDTLEAWTNGRLKSVVHRAIVNKEMQRLSLAYFLSPTLTTIIDTHPQLIKGKDGIPRKYMPFTWGHFRKQLLIQKRVVGKNALNRYRLT